MAIALIVFVLDSAWIDSEISKPGWDGQPDRDFVFMIGVLVRIVLINTALLPVGILAMWTRGRAWPWTTIKEHNEELAN